MGCWNETCLVSNLAIRAGDPVVAFLIAHHSIREERSYSGTCYSTDQAFPVSLPIRAEYNDYGFIENFSLKDIAVKNVKKLFNTDLDDMSESLHEGTTTISGGYIQDKPMPVGLVMINAHIYDTLVNKICQADKVKVKEEIANEIESKICFVKMSKDEKLAAFVKMESLAMSRNSSVVQYGGDTAFIKSVFDTAIDEAEKSPKRKKKIIDIYSEALAERVAAAWAMSELRKSWLPPPGKGSQNDNFSSHLVLATAIKEAALKNREPEELYLHFLGD